MEIYESVRMCIEYLDGPLFALAGVVLGAYLWGDAGRRNGY
mgnify:CR=1 FL=1